MFGYDVKELRLVHRSSGFGDVYVGWNDHGYSLTKMIQEDRIVFSVCKGSELLITWTEGVDGTPVIVPYQGTQGENDV